MKKKQSFEQMMEQLKFSKPTENNIRILHEHIGDDVIFARADIRQITGIDFEKYEQRKRVSPAGLL
jgi:hypothetical protein